MHFPNPHTQGLPLRILSFTTDVGNIRWGNIHIMRFVWFQVIISILSACARVGLHFVWCSLESGSIWRQRRLEVEAQLGQGGSPQLRAIIGQELTTFFNPADLPLHFKSMFLWHHHPTPRMHNSALCLSRKSQAFYLYVGLTLEHLKWLEVKWSRGTIGPGEVALFGMRVCVHRVAQTDRLDDQWSLLIKGLQK